MGKKGKLSLSKLITFRAEKSQEKNSNRKIISMFYWKLSQKQKRKCKFNYIHIPRPWVGQDWLDVVDVEALCIFAFDLIRRNATTGVCSSPESSPSALKLSLRLRSSSSPMSAPSNDSIDPFQDSVEPTDSTTESWLELFLRFLPSSCLPWPVSWAVSKWEWWVGAVERCSIRADAFEIGISIKDGLECMKLSLLLVVLILFMLTPFNILLLVGLLLLLLFGLVLLLLFGLLLWLLLWLLLLFLFIILEVALLVSDPLVKSSDDCIIFKNTRSQQNAHFLNYF